MTPWSVFTVLFKQEGGVLGFVTMAIITIIWYGDNNTIIKIKNNKIIK